MITDVRAYLRARAIAVGLHEWTDAFNVDNIPSTVIDKSFHLTMGVAEGIQRNQRDQEIEYPVEIRIAVKGFRSPADGVDQALAFAEALVVEALDPPNSLTQTRIKTVFFQALAVDPVAQSNDNLVVATLSLRVMGALAVET